MKRDCGDNKFMKIKIDTYAAHVFHFSHCKFLAFVYLFTFSAISHPNH